MKRWAGETPTCRNGKRLVCRSCLSPAEQNVWSSCASIIPTACMRVFIQKRSLHVFRWLNAVAHDWHYHYKHKERSIFGLIPLHTSTTVNTRIRNRTLKEQAPTNPINQYSWNTPSSLKPDFFKLSMFSFHEHEKYLWAMQTFVEVVFG